MKKEVLLQELGNSEYKQAWDYQENLLRKSVETKRQRLVPINYLLFTEHNPVYTLGNNGNPENVLIDEAGMRQKGVAYYHSNRGGDITYHGPGQLVGYPVLDLEEFKTDLGWYLRSLEEVMILTLADYGLKGERSKGETGVWLDAGLPAHARKICAMGIRCSHWITMHGFALNINTDLSFFDGIIPCGIINKKVTSMAKELQTAVEMSAVKKHVVQHFETVFETEVISWQQVAEL